MKYITVVLGCVVAGSSTMSAQDYTLNELLSRSNAAVIAMPRELSAETSPMGISMVPFIAVRLIKDDHSVDLNAVVMASCRPRDLAGDRFLLLRSKDRNDALRWEVRQSLSDEAVQHLVILSQADLQDVARLVYFYDLLEHPDPVISENADLEFLLASDETFDLFAVRLKAAELRERLVKENLPVHRRRLYLAMLAKSGDASDGDWIERQLLNPDDKSGTLDAYLAAYVTLKGEAGLELLDERYLARGDADIASTYSAILALRFASHHPQIGIAADRLRQSHRLVLDNPLLIDIAIHDLGRMEDWSSMDRIIELGVASEDSATRTATINYLRRCPGENASQKLTEMAGRYPRDFQRAITFLPNRAVNTNSARKPSSIRWTGRPGGC